MSNLRPGNAQARRQIVQQRGTKVRPKAIGGSNLGDLNVSAPLPKSITFVLDNSASDTDKEFKLFDTDGIVELINGKTYENGNTTIKGLNKVALYKFMAKRLVNFTGIRIQVEKSIAQFSNDLFLLVADVAKNNVIPKSVSLDDAISGVKQDEKIQNYDCNLPIDDLRALTTLVNAQEKVTATFYIKSITDLL